MVLKYNDAKVLTNAEIKDLISAKDSEIKKLKHELRSRQMRRKYCRNWRSKSCIVNGTM